jgi:nicotinamidase-related amidase
MRAGVRAERVMGMERDVVLVIDVQNSFVPGGSLAVPSGE